jgi:adenosylcobinamide kinase/adenosylcobinamide-phosphate guanylyltransferase
VSLPLVLVTGGARSGKTRFAMDRTLAECRRGGVSPVYLATAQPGDDEMAERIAAHRRSRGPEWTTVEEPLDVAGVLAGMAGHIVLLDCLTLWLSNVLLAGRSVTVGTNALCDELGERRSAVVCVTNEVGSGVVPETALGRAFRDEQGLLNQRIGDLADEVHLVVAGQPLRIK